MNINSILNTTRPVSLYEKEKDTRDTSFMDILAQTAKETSAEQIMEYTVSADEKSNILNVGFWENPNYEAERKDPPSYTVTDEQAEYFREKYGENYDEETLADLFYELADEGIISYDDASKSTCCLCIRRAEIIGYVDPPPGVEPAKWTLLNLKSGRFQEKPGEILYSKHRDILPYEYEDFKRDYNKDVVTWEDFIQEQRDFYEYMKNRDTMYDAERNLRPNNPLVGYDERLEGLERAAEVIKQIFG